VCIGWIGFLQRNANGRFLVYVLIMIRGACAHVHTCVGGGFTHCVSLDGLVVVFGLLYVTVFPVVSFVVFCKYDFCCNLYNTI
jgi:hypothetical protein